MTTPDAIHPIARLSDDELSALRSVMFHCKSAAFRPTGAYSGIAG